MIIVKSETFLLILIFPKGIEIEEAPGELKFSVANLFCVEINKLL